MDTTESGQSPWQGYQDPPIELCTAEKKNTDGQSEEDSYAVKFLDHLLKDGAVDEITDGEIILPPWYDEKLFKRAQEYLWKYHFIMFSGMLTGLVAVLAIPSIQKILIATRQSSTARTAYKRYVQTTFHVLEWFLSPLEKGSKMYESLKMVRKGHANASRACSKQDKGKITQKDMALTQWGFFGFFTLGAHRISLYDDDFLEATCHMWRVIGYVLGIKDEYNICLENWAKTKPRLEIVMRKVFKPALENTTPEFEAMTKAMLEGMGYIVSTITPGSYVFYTKRLAYCQGYEFFDADFPNGVRVPNQKQYFEDLSLWDRILVRCGLYIVTYLHKYSIVRWYLNFRSRLSILLAYYLPTTAIFSYGPEWAYVRIFTSHSAHNKYKD